MIGNHRTPQTRFGAALQLRNPGGDVAQRNQGHTHQALGIGRAVFRQPIIKDAEAGILELGVFEAEQRQAIAGVQHLGQHAVDILVLGALAWIHPLGRLAS